nr:hypothetical protein [Tanacetum cinerariifolium]
FIDLPNRSSAIYSAELSSRLRAFLVACHPAAPSPHVTDLVAATADFQKDLASWNVNPVYHDLDIKEFFHLYIMIWIQDKRLYLLETCKLDKYADVVATLKETSNFFGLKRTRTLYTAPPELGVLLNSMERMLDVLRQIERQLKSWENTRLQNGTKLKKILEDSKKSVGDSEIRSRMEPLIEQLKNTMNHLHKILETPVFITTCREYWDRMGQDVVSFLAKRKDKRSWYKGSNVAVSILDDTFASQMQQLLPNTLQEKDTFEPPRSIVEVRSMLCKDAGSYITI